MQGLKPFLLPIVAAVVLVLLYLMRPESGTDAAVPSSASAAKPAAAPAAKSSDGGAPTPSAEPAVDPTSRTSAAPPQPRQPATPPSPARAQRDALREKISSALGDGQPARPAQEAAPEATGTLDRGYIRERIKEDLLPIAVECYDSALQDDDQVAGRLTMQFTIVGAEDVGGVVDEVVLTEDTEITHAELVECMTESMMSVTFDPPEGGGTVTVTYPFIFEAEDPKP